MTNFKAILPGDVYKRQACTVEIDGEEFHNIGLRAKGNNSLRLTKEYGLSRYSLKLEFDQFQDGGNYYGLDKLSLDASFQDNSYLKTYMVYDMMAFMGVPAPLCSYTWVTVNGAVSYTHLDVYKRQLPGHTGWRADLRRRTWKAVPAG